MAKKKRISVVIPGHNEEGYMDELFKGLKDQTFKNFEVIFVDWNSTDRTRQIASKHAKVIREKRRGIGLARNTGARYAKGDIILFMNADTAPSKDLLRIYHETFRDKSVAAASGPLLPLESVSTFLRFGYWFASVVLAKASYVLGTPAISGSNFAVRKSDFKKVRGYDERFATYEDLDMSKRLKKVGRIVYVDDAKVRTSARRIRAWGLPKYIYFNATNVVKYNLMRKAHEDYEFVR